MIGLDSADVIDDLTHMLQLFKHKTCYLQRLLHRLVHEYFDQREILETKAHLSTLFDEEIELVEQLHRYSRPLKMYLSGHSGSCTDFSVGLWRSSITTGPDSAKNFTIPSLNTTNKSRASSTRSLAILKEIICKPCRLSMRKVASWQLQPSNFWKRKGEST